LGCSNGFSHKVLSKKIPSDPAADKRFRILATVQPGNGSDPFLIRVLDNKQAAVINVRLKQDSGNIIEAKGPDSAKWIDTGVSYAPGDDCRLEIVQDNTTQSFSLSVNGAWVLKDIASGSTDAGIGYLCLVGGGNKGEAIRDQYTYVDDLSVQAVSDVPQ